MSGAELQERVREFKSRRARMVHAENPEQLGYALCGFQLALTKPASGDRHACVVCSSFAQRDWFLR